MGVRSRQTSGPREPGDLSDPGGGPSFERDSVVLPVDAAKERPGEPSRSMAPMAADQRSIFRIVIPIGLIVGVVAALLVMRAERAQDGAIPPEEVPADTPVVLAPVAIPDEPVAAAAPRPAAPVPDPDDAPVPVLPTADEPTPSGSADPAGSTKRRPRRPKRTRAFDAKVDDALARIGQFTGKAGPMDPIAPEGGKKDSQTAGSDPAVGTKGESPPSATGAPDAECASPEVCVREGKRSERGADADGGTRARELYRRACRQGAVEGCWRLARLLERGIGGPREPAEAVKLRKKACGLGHSNSCAGLAATSSATGAK